MLFRWVELVQGQVGLLPDSQDYTEKPRGVGRKAEFPCKLSVLMF